jgi:predicted ATPase/transcriptional regulator with XRE-family HTH domain
MEQEVRAGSPEFGQLLRRYRLAAGLSQEALAERARMSTEGISALERGYRRSPQRETLELLARALTLDNEQRRDFEAAARAGTARRPGPASVTVGPWPEAGAAALPLALTSYVGRERETSAIAGLVRESRLVTLTGAGGIGKTRAALQAAATLGEDWEYPPRFVSLTSAVDASSVTQCVAAGLGIQEVPNHALRETLQSYLDNKAMLLILDNCEHVVGDAAQLVKTLLSSCPRVRILATSREPLRVLGEHAYRLPSLAMPSSQESRELTADAALEYGAVRLFVDRARSVNHRFELTNEQVPNVTQLCRHLDGIPLAIELAAARANALSVRELNERLGERFRLLAGGERTALPRQQTMRATIDWSYNLLSLPERRLFERLSVFAGGCTLAAAARICGDDAQEVDMLDLLTALTDKSLVAADLNGDETRYRLLESFREYAREKLAARGETEALARRHALVCLEMAQTYNSAAEANLDELFRATAASELENWRAALEWTLAARNDALLGQELVSELETFWGAFAPVEGRRWLLAAAEQIDDGTPTKVLAALSYAQANVAMVLREVEAQLAYARIAIAHYRALGDALGVARAQARAGRALVAMEMERMPEGIALLREALATAGKLKNSRLAAHALRCLGEANFRSGDYATARRYYSEAVKTLQAMGARLVSAAAMEDLAEIEFAAGDPEAAARHATVAVTIMRGTLAPRALAITLNQLACCLNIVARHDEAEERAREALDVALQHGVQEAMPEALQHLAAAAALREQVSAGNSSSWVRAARLLGFVDARIAALDATRTHLESQEYDRVLAVLRGAIGDARVAEAMAAGSVLTQEQAIDEYLRATRSELA